MFKYFCKTVALIQIVLGLAYLFFPAALLQAMGHQLPPADLHYPLAMLAARFLAYGLGFWIISSAPAKNRLWIRLMALIQAVDLAAGAFYVSARPTHL